MAAQFNIAIQQLAQIGHAEKIAQELQSHPEIQGQTTELLAKEALKQQSESVEKPEDSEKSRSISSREKKRRERRQHHADAQKKAAEAEQEEEPGTADSPWSGNILNLKV